MAATTISRTWFDTLADDSGGGTDGTIIDVADFDAILDAIDALIAGNLELGGNLIVPGTLNVTGIATLAGATIVLAGITYTLPTDNGDSGEVLTTDGAGVLTWAAAGGGTVDVSGTPANNYLAVWTDADTLEGPSTLQYDGSILFINDSANAKMTTGLTLNQGAADDEIIAFKSSDVDHGMTTLAETDTYGFVRKVAGATGGMQFFGFGEAEAGIVFTAAVTGANTTKNSGANAPFYLGTGLKSGTTITDMGADANLVAIDDGTAVRWIVDNEGDTYRDGTDNTYDEYDDASLALAWEHAMNPKAKLNERFAAFCDFNLDRLVTLGILADVDPRTGRRFYNESALLRLVAGATWQQALKVDRLGRAANDAIGDLMRRVVHLEDQLKQLTA